MSTGQGAGSAADAAVGTSPMTDDERERAKADYAVLEENVGRAKEKVQKFKAHLDAANEGLANAKAELADAEKPEGD